MKIKHIVQAVVAGAAIATMSSANATYFVGSPTPSLSPVFGTLVNFDDKATGTAVLSTDYVAFGVASVKELEGLGTFARYAGSQSSPNYIGTGFGGERGTDAPMGWDGTIEFEFTSLVSKVGIGIADSSGGPEHVSVFDSSHTLLETYVVSSGSNVYVGIDRTSFGDIKYFQVTGDFFAADDLQLLPVPEPETYAMLLAGLGLLGFSARRRKV